MPFQAFYLDHQGQLRSGLKEEEIKEVLASPDGLLWVDIEGTTEEDGIFLRQAFGFHPLAVEDCVEEMPHTPKMDRYDDYLFLILHGVNYTAETHIIQTSELDIFIGHNLVVTNHNLHLYSVEAITRLVERDGNPMNRGADFLAYAIIDALVNNIMPGIDRLGERADEIEEITFQNPPPSTMEAILHLKRSGLRLRRAMAPQREVLSSLSRTEHPQIRPEAGVFFRDVYDGMVRIEGFVEQFRERTDAIMTSYMSAVAYQQNETMKTLSLIAAIFLPLTLLAGIYGMNFEHMPELGLSWGYYGILGVMGAVAVAVVWWFWARRWISVGRKRLERFVPAAVNPERLLDYVSHITRWTHN